MKQAKKREVERGGGRKRLGRALPAAVAALFATLAVAASPSPPSPPAASPSVAPSAPETSVSKLPDARVVLSYLSQAIGWYRDLGIQERQVSEPMEALFLADNRQMANEVLALAFDYARAQAHLMGKSAQPQAPATTRAKPAVKAVPGGVPELEDLKLRLLAAEQEVKTAQDKLKSLQQKLASAPARERRALASQISAVQSEIDLAQARAESFKTMIDFESRSAYGGEGGAGLLAQIEELERSVPEALPGAKKLGPAQPLNATGAMRQRTQPNTIAGLAENLFRLNRRVGVLEHSLELNRSLEGSVQRLRSPLIDALVELKQRGTELGKQPTSGDIVRLREQKTNFEELIARHQYLVSAAIPLSKQLVILKLYGASLQRWQTSVRQRAKLELHRLVVRLSVLALALALVFMAAALWQRVTFRYVQDQRRRHQLLQVRRIAVAAIVGLLLLFNFASEIGAIATVLGLAAAGVALALQNVILSVAGYFFLIGKFGLKVGDRVEVSGCIGDVIDLGLVKLSLMELRGDGTDHQPTGRVVVFSNAVVFQPNGNFAKQIPRTSFTWNEVSLMLAPECDYQLAEKRLLEAVNEVFARYKDSIERQYRAMQLTFNVTVEAPRPQSRLRLSKAGLEVSIRYPAELRHATQIGDEVTRHVLDAIDREPALKLVGQGAPNVQAAPRPPQGAEGDRLPPNADSGKRSP